MTTSEKIYLCCDVFVATLCFIVAWQLWVAPWLRLRAWKREHERLHQEFIASHLHHHHHDDDDDEFYDSTYDPFAEKDDDECEMCNLPEKVASWEQSG